MSIEALKEYALAQNAMIQFKAPDGTLIFAKKDDLDGAGNMIKVPDLDRPLGVRMVAPGSKEAREAEDQVAKLARKRGEQMSKREREANALSSLVWIGNEKAARMVTAFVGFDYPSDGERATVDNVRAFLNDPEWAFFADQIRSATGDYDAFLPKDSAS